MPLGPSIQSNFPQDQHPFISNLLRINMSCQDSTVCVNWKSILVITMNIFFSYVHVHGFYGVILCKISLQIFQRLYLKREQLSILAIVGNNVPLYSRHGGN